jgi:hypothetical protein
MKPKEFDELVRQKFDRNDFEYNPRNWEKLAEDLDGRAKKRSIIMWWWLPLTGIAASVAIAIGVSFTARQGFYQPGSSAIVNKEQPRGNMLIQSAPVTAGTADAQNKVKQVTVNFGKGIHNKKHYNKEKNIEYSSAIKLQNAIVEANNKPIMPPFIFMGSGINPVKKEKKEIAQNAPVKTFKPAIATIPSKNSIILLGGINHGSQNSGYMAGATFRHMINTRLYMESDVAYANSDNSQSTYVPVASSANARHAAAAGRQSGMAGRTDGNPEIQPYIAPAVQTENQTYSVNYAQVSPALGYKIMKKMSIGAGPDFQQMLSDNRPVQSTEYRGAIQEAPLFDVGFIGKTEYSLTKNIKAGVSYRKGINNFVTPTATDKYIDRDYLMIQLKWAILNK